MAEIEVIRPRLMCSRCLFGLVRGLGTLVSSKSLLGCFFIRAFSCSTLFSKCKIRFSGDELGLGLSLLCVCALIVKKGSALRLSVSSQF